jgi:hypothetical protein
VGGAVLRSVLSHNQMLPAQRLQNDGRIHYLAARAGVSH